MAAPSDRNSRSTPERAVWGDVEDWHCTLDLIARKWGPPTLQPPLTRTVLPGSSSSTDPLTTAVVPKHAGVGTSSPPEEKEPSATLRQICAGPPLAPTAAEQPGGVQATPSAPSQSTPIEGLRNKSPVGRAPAVDSPRLAGKPSVSSRKRHTASLPRPSDVEALLRKETQRRRPTSPHSFPHSPSSDSRDAVNPGHFVDQTSSSSSSSSSSSFSSAPPALPTTPSTDHEAADDPEASSKPRASSYSAPTDLRNAFVTVQHHQPGGGAPNNDGVILSLLELQKRPVPASLNKATLEAYLSDDEFSSALGMPRDQFYGLRAWKQTQVKKKAGLL